MLHDGAAAGSGGGGTQLQELEDRVQQLTEGQEEVCPYNAMQPYSAM